MKNPFYRKPDEDLKRANGAEYLHRWWIIPRNKVFNIYLHKFLGDDADDVLHDHPWPSWSFILKGKYIEHLPGDKMKVFKRWSLIYRPAGYAHRIELFKDKVIATEWEKRGTGNQVRMVKMPRRVWTIFITGKKVREWGFHCSTGWVHWKKFVSKGGCGE